MSIWTQIHGGATHFPIALMAASSALDTAALCAKARRGELRSAAFYALVLAAAGAVGAAFSGLALCHWNFASDGLLAAHHKFVWPAGALVIALAAFRIHWRARRGADALWPTGMTVGFLASSFLATGLMCGAGYWGGEMLLQ